MVAPCHYDGSHNVYAQLGKARKHFVLVPHTQQSAALLRPFPFVHPSHAQCQVDLTTLPSSTLVRLLPAFPTRTAARRGAAVRRWWNCAVRSVCVAQAAVGATQASVGPGDVLYLPPMYFHHVTSLGTSLSVNVWTACADERVVEQITAATRTYLSSSAWREGLMHQLPSAARIDAPRLAPLSALAAFVPLAVAAGLRARSFVDDLYAERYAELMATSEIPKLSASVVDLH